MGVGAVGGAVGLGSRLSPRVRREGRRGAGWQHPEAQCGLRELGWVSGVLSWVARQRNLYPPIPWCSGVLTR